MIKKIFTSMLTVLLVLALLLTTPALFSTKVEAVSNSAVYLRDNEYFTISPAEKWDNGMRKATIAEGWELNVEDGGFRNGHNIHMWNDGSNSRFCAFDVDGKNTFRIQIQNGRFWDVDDRSKDSGKGIHVWDGREEDENDDSQRFYLIDNNDGDPETFYIVNLNSGKYIVPKNYFKNPDNDKSQKDNWDNNGCQVIQSSFSFSWRIHILNRDVLEAVNYFYSTDYFVMSPAEKWDGGKRSIIPTAEWEVTAQNEGNTNGDDIQIYKFGISSKFRISGLNSANTFKIQITNYQETKAGKYWDIKNRSLSSGAIVHSWSGRNTDDRSQRFYLIDDKDGNPETFFIKNLNSGKYLVPRDYFKDPGNDISENENWMKNGVNLIQSNFAFRWRFHVLNREIPEMKTNIEWMSKLAENTYLANLTIPGTHDSSTANVSFGEVSGLNNVACQKYFFDEQLIAGIRAFDLRTAENDYSKTFVMVHNTFVCHESGRKGAGNMKLDSVFKEMTDFLTKHPREAIIATLKIDGDGADDTAVKRRLAELLLDNYFTHANNENYFYQWYDPNTDDQSTMLSPILWDVRGKIVLLNRVDFSDIPLDENFTSSDLALLRSFTGPDISKWDEKYDDGINYAQVVSPNDSGVKVWAQDDWHSSLDSKLEKFTNTIKQLNNNLQKEEKYIGVPIPSTKSFVFNYTSMNFSTEGNNPLEAARNMNNVILNDSIFYQNHRGGIIMMDYASEAVARIILNQSEVFNHTNNYPTYSAAKVIDSGIEDLSVTAERLASNAETMILESGLEINWPTGATVTYGYILSEATLHFDDTDKLNSISGYYYFENSSDILTVKDDNGQLQTLIFESYDGTVKRSAQIPVTVNPRDLPISIGNYQVEYGEKFDITQTPYPTAGGYFLHSDKEKLDMVIAASGLRYKAVDAYENDITVTSETKPCSGIIRLTADKPEEIKHPNYVTSTQNGVWTILPRTVSVSWNYESDGWKASIDNIINGDDVFAVVSPDSDGKGATLMLGGSDADAYRIAEADIISPTEPNEPDNPDTSDISQYAEWLLSGILGLAVCGFLLRKKIIAE